MLAFIYNIILLLYVLIDYKYRKHNRLVVKSTMRVVEDLRGSTKELP